MGKHLVPVFSAQGEGQLRRQQPVLDPDVIAPCRLLQSQNLFTPGQLCQGVGQGNTTLRARSRNLPLQDLEDH